MHPLARTGSLELRATLIAALLVIPGLVMTGVGRQPQLKSDTSTAAAVSQGSLSLAVCRAVRPMPASPSAAGPTVLAMR
jgi:hypothetical protein